MSQHFGMTDVYQRIHQRALAGALRPSDGYSLVVDAGCVNVSSGDELPNAAFIEVAIACHHLQNLLLVRHGA